MARCRKISTVQEGLLNETVWTAVEEAVLNPNVIAEQVAKLNQSKADRTEHRATRSYVASRLT